MSPSSNLDVGSKAPNLTPTRFSRPKQLVLPIPGLAAGPYALLDCPGQVPTLVDETAVAMAVGRAGWLGAWIGGVLDRHWLPDRWLFQEVSFMRWRATGWAVVVKATDENGDTWRAWHNEATRQSMVPALIWLVRKNQLAWRKMSRK